jgi:D-3-phosphoglycerate dehydrogenase
MPHLGASTPEAETNSAVMAARQLADYLEFGHVTELRQLSRTCALAMSSETVDDRMVFLNRNVPNMVGQITTILAEAGLNISDMLNRHRGDYAYNIIDIDSSVDETVIDRLRTVDGIVRIRAIRRGEAR